MSDIQKFKQELDSGLKTSYYDDNGRFLSPNYAVKMEDLDLLKKLYDQDGWECGTLSQTDENILHFAATIKVKNPEIYKYLIAKCYKFINIADKVDGLTPLMLAAMFGNLEMMTQLLQCDNIDIHMEDRIGRTAMFIANNYRNVTKKHEECAQMLEDYLSKHIKHQAFIKSIRDVLLFLLLL